jgi:hypothetical protein
MTEREEKVLCSEVRELRLAVGSLLTLNQELVAALLQHNIADAPFADMTHEVLQTHKRSLGFRE